LLGSIFNIQNEKISMAAMISGVLIFSGFLIKSYTRKDRVLAKTTGLGRMYQLLSNRIA
jgi:hypothetical protein